MDQELLQSFTPQKYTCIQRRTLLRNKMNYSDSKRTHITFHHGACNHHLGLEQLKDRTVKYSTTVLALWSTIILEFLHDFSNKTHSFLVWPFHVSHLWYFWILTKAWMVYAFSLLSEYVVFVELRHSGIMPSFSLTLHLIGLCGAHRWGRKLKHTCKHMLYS